MNHIDKMMIRRKYMTPDLCTREWFKRLSYGIHESQVKKRSMIMPALDEIEDSIRKGVTPKRVNISTLAALVLCADRDKYEEARLNQRLGFEDGGLFNLGPCESKTRFDDDCKYAARHRRGVLKLCAKHTRWHDQREHGNDDHSR